jgi:hypothetical protein
VTFSFFRLSLLLVVVAPALAVGAQQQPAPQGPQYVLIAKRLASFAGGEPPYLWLEPFGAQSAKQSNGAIVESASVSVKGPSRGQPIIDGTLRVTIFPPEKSETAAQIEKSTAGLRDAPHAKSTEFSTQPYLYSAWSTQKTPCQEAIRGIYFDEEEEEFRGMLSLAICSAVPKETFITWFDRIEVKDPITYYRDWNKK